MAGTFICAYRLNGDGSGTAIDEGMLQSVNPPSAPIWVHLSARSEGLAAGLKHKLSFRTRPC